MRQKNFLRVLSKLSALFSLSGMAMLLSGCGAISNISADDGSISLLNTLFGTPLQGALSGSIDSKEAFPVLVHAFNMGVMGAAMLIFAYIAFMGTLYTAQDGVFLGKKWSKSFIPLRAVFGVIAVFPMGASGFGIAQYIIYAMTYAGVGLADEVWKAVAKDASAGGLSPGIPLSVLQGIDTAVAEMIFYDVVSNVTGNSLSALESTSPANHSDGAQLSSQHKNLLQVTPCASGLPAKTACVSVGPVPMTRTLFNAMSAGLAPGVVGNGILSNLGGQANDYHNNTTNGVPWIDNLVFQIQANLTNASILDDQPVGDIQYLYGQANATTSYYLESDVELYFTGVINGLPAPPANMGLSDEVAGQTYPTTDPVSAAYIEAQSVSQSIITAGALYNSPFTAQVFSSDDYMTALSNILTVTLAYYDKTHPGNKTENFSDSWWNAGDEYLYLDQVFAEEVTSLFGVIGDFQTKVAGTTKNLVQITNGGVFANFTELNLTSAVANGDSMPGNKEVVDCGVGAPNTTTGCGYMLYAPPSGSSVFIPLPLGNNLSALAAQASLWTSGTNAQLAAYDLLCKFGGTVTPTNGTATNYCNSTGLAKFAPDPDGGVPHVLDLTQGPFPVILEDLYYYFALMSTGKSPVYQPQDIYTLDLAVNYAYNAYQTSDTADPCPHSTGTSSSVPACNPNSPGWDNPMIIAGSNSPMGNVMGFIFSGLVGAKSGSTNIAGLMAQIWCVGEVDFAKCMKNVQTPESGSGISVPSKGIVDAHFSVIANAQWVGMNLIGGSVAALTSIYTDFGQKIKKILGSVSGAGGISAGDWAAAAIPGFGGIATASFSQSLIKATTQATVSVAAASVSLMWLPVVMIVLSTLFTTGVMFAIFIPMLPFVLFWAGKIAWILLVVEAIFAAPLMALAIAYPEGHDLWGMGEQGFKISLNLVLMPVLMIVGLVSAMAITYFILNMTATGFHYVSMALLSMAEVSSGGTSSVPGHGSSITAGNASSLVTQGIMSTFLVFMYASFISMAFSKSFSTIYVIPERVMSWIGSQGMKFGEKEGGEMQGAVSKQAGEAAQGGGQAVSQGTQAQKGVADAKISQTQQEGQAEIQTAGSVGQALTTVAQTAASLAG
jgi:hypothetical protein